jgi:hypothetical protein
MKKRGLFSSQSWWFKSMVLDLLSSGEGLTVNGIILGGACTQEVTWWDSEEETIEGPGSLFFFFFFLVGLVSTLGFPLTEQELYDLSHSTTLFCVGHFQDRVC